MMDPEQNEPGITTTETLEASAAPAMAQAGSEPPPPPFRMSEPDAAEVPQDEESDELHNLFAVPAGDDPLAAMRDDPNYAALIKELEYIAAQARALFEPSEEAPSDDVWTKIQSQLPTLNDGKDDA